MTHQINQMENATFSFSSNIFGYVVRIISLIAMGLSVFLYRSHLPSHQMKALDDLLKDTGHMSMGR